MRRRAFSLLNVVRAWMQLLTRRGLYVTSIVLYRTSPLSSLHLCLAARQYSSSQIWYGPNAVTCSQWDRTMSNVCSRLKLRPGSENGTFGVRSTLHGSQLMVNHSTGTAVGAGGPHGEDPGIRT